MAEVIHLGGSISCGRLYLDDLDFDMPGGQHVSVKKTFKPDGRPGHDTANLIARHRGRYHLLGLFCRPGMKVLDFPCGSGYAAQLLEAQGIIYEGRDFDEPTLEYARHMYSGPKSRFNFGDLTKPELATGNYDLIGCLEGIEHINQGFQLPAIEAFWQALKPGGILVISSPENSSGESSPGRDNQWHEWELNKNDFMVLLASVFEAKNVELITLREVLHTGVMSTCFYAVCRKSI
ncbi:MAG: hypothetical protein A3J46_05455 [Candidatus Yanofskybacteria bacterium RIFCSPHIGHO2_02_FULL_41_11]|uniref:Methyltransferase domain-containing protein n=1 Tax=Candidatus Yanofskybacteria bacterium RIFCSPHIGHO2_02_FULL_41_11 TaxID=1802675 RepID=A0A1F8FBT5_9BACT|nr:MAG: hypothetical protein A3J46_05455 [Candidatus Yanofskybacteria bacterium RIFCSPHIGHO2_02_FULL_41_11]